MTTEAFILMYRDFEYDDNYHMAHDGGHAHSIFLNKEEADTVCREMNRKQLIKLFGNGEIAGYINFDNHDDTELLNVMSKYCDGDIKAWLSNHRISLDFHGTYEESFKLFEMLGINNFYYVVKCTIVHPLS